MPAPYADRVQETTSVVGTGTMTLLGAVAGYRDFATAFPAASTAGVPYTIVDAAGNWETGHGTFTLSGTTLTRAVTASSNANALVSFGAGPKVVFNTMLAADAVGLAIANIFTKAQTSNPVTLVQTTGNISTDASLGNNFEVVLTQNATILAPTNMTPGQVINHLVQQPASGGPYTVTWASAWDWGGASTPVASTANSKVDLASGIYSALTGKIIASYRKGS